jgi:exonuclease VII small subunit
MLDSGNDKLNEAMKQLVNIRACKEKLQGKLMKAQGTLTEMTTKHSNTDEKLAGPSAKKI